METESEIEKLQREIIDAAISWFRSGVKVLTSPQILAAIVWDLLILMVLDFTWVSAILGPVDDVILGTLAAVMGAELYLRYRVLRMLEKIRRQPKRIDITPPSTTSSG